MALRKLFKIVIAILAVIIILFVAFGALFFLDIASYGATGQETLQASGASVGNALVAYNPGLSGDTKAVADKVAAALQAKGYTVTLAGIRSSALQDTSGFNVIVVGGPIYAGGLTASVKDALARIAISQGTAVGVFGSGQGATTIEDIAQIRQSMPARQELSDATVVKIGNTEDITARTQDLVNQLAP